MKIDASYPVLVISAPELAEHKEFVRWLNAGVLEDATIPVASWHRPRESGPRAPDEWSDVFMWMEHREGSDSDMPEDVWNQICDLAGDTFAGLVWIKFF